MATKETAKPGLTEKAGQLFESGFLILLGINLAQAPKLLLKSLGILSFITGVNHLIKTSQS